MKAIWCAAVAAAVLAGCPQANSTIIPTTNYSYYTVSGSTPAQIYAGIMARGPSVNGRQALASIKTRASQDGGIAEAGGSCKVSDYTINLDFIIQRPRIANISVLPAADRAKWDQLYAFLKAHEDQHKATWTGCASELDRQVSSLNASSCDKVSAQADKLWAAMLAKCDKKQKSFDAAQTRALMKLPFMQRAASGAKASN